MHATVLYHIRKQKKGVAEFLAARNFIKEKDQLTQRDIEYEFERLQDPNERTRQKTMHLLVTFHEGAKVSNEQMVGIADEYMKRMGMDEQPYLTIRHYDSEMPHMHIVSSYIREGGERIRLDLKEYYKSVQLANELAAEYKLEPPTLTEEEWKQQPLRPVDPSKVPLKQSFNRVLDRVLDEYQYASLDEFNAVLREYRSRPHERSHSMGGGLLCAVV